MKWDEIENNWLAMTRRVRPERPEPSTIGSPRAEERQPSGDMADTTADWPEQAASSTVAASRLIV